MNESFLLANDPMFSGFATSLYWPYEPDFSRRMFEATARNANAAGLRGRRNVSIQKALSPANGQFYNSVVLRLSTVTIFKK